MVIIGGRARGCLPQLPAPEAVVGLSCWGLYTNGVPALPNMYQPQWEQLDFINLFHLCFLRGVSIEQDVLAESCSKTTGLEE